ncbi:MAG: c-type cytochrome [Cyanobacteria bacterium P01_A01_bin.83]
MNGNFRSRRTFVIAVAVVLTLLLWLVSPFVLNRYRYPVQYANIDEHFRYGSIGGEDSDGIPYWIIKVLPTVFADKLPGEGYTSLGFIQEPDHELPISFVRSTNSLGVEVITENCATCHVGTLRASAADTNPQIISAMPGFTVSLQGFVRFLTESAADDRFTANNLMPFINEAGANFNPLEKLLYRFVVIPRTRDELLELRHDFSFMNRQSPYGPGRVDTFTSYKTRRYGFPVEKLAETELTGISDYPSIWNQAPRQTMRLHWDGNNNDGSERNLTAALALVSPTTIDLDSLARLRTWLDEIKAPPYPYAIDRTLAAKGEVLFDNNCASCHTEQGSQIGTVTPIEEVGTDRGRIDSYTYELASNQNLTFSGITYQGVDQRFSHFKKTNGYANSLLDGLWLRSPYLHNGSVPTLRDLLNKPEDRPKSFYRGYDVFDQENVGYVSTVASENGKEFFLYDTELPSNYNMGHLYGTDLDSQDKDALLEYLKTL